MGGFYLVNCTPVRKDVTKVNMCVCLSVCTYMYAPICLYLSSFHHGVHVSSLSISPLSPLLNLFCFSLPKPLLFLR